MRQTSSCSLFVAGTFTYRSAPCLFCLSIIAAAEDEQRGAVATGWSNSEVTDVGSAGLVHGPWGNDVKDVSISIPVPVGVSLCEVSWRSWAADSRDGEIDRVLIDGTEVWSMASRCYTGSDGWERGPEDFPNPWNGQNGEVCFLDVFRQVDCSAPSLELRFQSGIDEGEGAESWGFSRVRVVVGGEGLDWAEVQEWTTVNGPGTFFICEPVVLSCEIPCDIFIKETFKVLLKCFECSKD